MKACCVIVLTFLSAFTVNGQCDEYISIEVDRVSGKSTKASKELLIVSEDGGKTGFGILVMDLDKSIVVSIQALGASPCIREDDKINVLFRDGSRLEMNNDKDFNCQSEVAVYFGGVFGRSGDAEKLASREVEIMRVWTSDGYVEKALTSEQSKRLMHTFACLWKQ